MSKYLNIVLVIVFSSFLNVATHFSADLTHIPLLLDKFGFFLSALTIGPFYTALVGLTTGLLFGLFDKTFFVRFPAFILLGFLWGLGFKYTEKRRLSLIIFSIAGGIALSLADLMTFTVFLYNPLVSHVLPYFTFFNMFMNEFIDSVVCFWISFILFKFTGVLSKLHELKYTVTAMKVAILAGVVVAASVIPLYVARAQDYALSSGLPKPANWVFRVTRMDFAWAPVGLKGVNYYYYPPDRFNRSNPVYQVWFGIYWIQGRHGLYDDTYVSEEIYAFSILDQNAWLSLHGLKNPETKVYGETDFAWSSVSGYQALFMNGSYSSQSDVAPHEDIVLNGFITILYIPRLDRTAIVYACAQDKYYSQMEKTLWDLFHSVQWP